MSFFSLHSISAAASQQATRYAQTRSRMAADATTGLPATPASDTTTPADSPANLQSLAGGSLGLGASTDIFGGGDDTAASRIASLQSLMGPDVVSQIMALQGGGQDDQGGDDPAIDLNDPDTVVDPGATDPGIDPTNGGEDAATSPAAALSALDQALDMPQDSTVQAPADTFAALDTDGDGVVSLDEITQAVTAGGGTADAATALFNVLDPDGGDGVTADQFAANVPMAAADTTGTAQPPAPTTNNSQQASLGMFALGRSYDLSDSSLFNQLDVDGDGQLMPWDLEQAVRDGGGTTQSADALFSQLDPASTGVVTPEQFASVFPLPSFNMPAFMA